MDWIERLFNISPDNGDGTLEALIVILAVLAALVLVASLRPGGRRMLARLRDGLLATVGLRPRRSGQRP
jgi:hypothetical protein